MAQARADGFGDALRPWIAPAAVMLVLVGALVAVLVLASRASDSGLPPQPGDFVLPRVAVPTIAFDVERSEDGKLTVASGQDATRRRVQLTIPGATTVDLLEVVTIKEIHVGDWVTVIGVTNEVRNFAIRLVVVIPSDGRGPSGDQPFLLTPAGFTGHEAARESREAPILGGIVESVDEDAVSLATRGGSVTLKLIAGAPLRRVRNGSPGDIEEGDRIALHAGEKSEGEPAKGVLVLVGGAR